MNPDTRYLNSMVPRTGPRTVFWRTPTGLAAWYESNYGPVRAEAANSPDLARELAVGARQLETFHLRSLEEIARSKTSASSTPDHSTVEFLFLVAVGAALTLVMAWLARQRPPDDVVGPQPPGTPIG